MKQCYKCLMTKPITEFYRAKRMASGYLNVCIQCRKEDARKYREADIERVRAYDRDRGSQSHRIKARIVYKKNQRKKYPERNVAYMRLDYAVRSKKLHKPSSCSICNRSGYIIGHHNDYTKPLDVLWVCMICHSRIHKSSLAS